MGWPKRDEGARVYYERASKTYLLVFPDARLLDGCLEAVGEVMIDNDPERPQLASSSVSPLHIYKKCRRAHWGDIPSVWQAALAEWLADPPETYRGLWRCSDEKR